jgi:hypothetical protein
MNANAFMGIVRALVPALVAYLVGKGIVPSGEAADFGAALIAMGAAGWSVFTNWDDKSKTVKAAQ